ncbi:manganese catalase family protein [Crassaminicella indica]|uniref:Manganese catalase family protein n=1 Tax=Crassaminicella indica TaxID=2855394 RepID=A0ABX8RAI3_9CLOT|nr:manganese catalase family protein [Crassaminicella indica]QXM05447.1 manganese catalase family protein [Crassaminicella indica]
MWIYEKKLQYPVKISCKDPRMAQYVMTQLGGPDGELSAALTYLNQRYKMPTKKATALLTDIGTEELAHVEMIQTMIVKLTEDVSIEEIKKMDMGQYYAIRDTAVYPADSTGNPWTASYVSSTGNPVADLYNDMAAEKKAKAVYENLIKLTDDPLLKDSLRFLLDREIVHFKRFGEALRSVEAYNQSKKCY